jgi:cardiolipin synthase
MPWILSFVFIAVEVLAIASAVHALFTVRTAQGTIAWVIGLITFPWLGLPLYWFFGSRRFDAHSKVMKQALITHQEKIHDVREEMRPFQVERSTITPSRAGDLAAVAGEEFLAENKLDLLIDGEATFDAILAEVAKAQRCIYVQFYIMREDGLGVRLLEALAARAAEGLEVCFLFDRVGSISMKSTVIEKWRRRGIKMATFCAHSEWRVRWQLNFRNHR